jgi:hypothetical protein
MAARLHRHSAGARIEEAELPTEAVRKLRAHGVVSCAQLHDLLDRRWSDAQTRQVFGVDLDQARTSVGRSAVRRLPGAVTRKLARHTFPLPAITGIRGPVSEHAWLRLRREQRRAERKKVVACLERLQDDLPTKALLTDWMAPIGDQGRLGSCVGWGSTANRELLAQDRLSPLFAYALAKHLDGRPDLEGSWQHFAFLGFVRFGHLRESEYPYTDQPEELLVEPYLDEAEEFRANAYADVLLDPEDMELQPVLIKAILSGRLNGELGPQPVSTSLAIYESWDTATTALYGLVTIPFEGERLLGGHALCVAGYIDGNDPDGLYGTDYFVVKNSWGTAWAPENPLGLAGYALIPAAYFADARRHWEALVCLAEPSPVRSAGWLDLLRAAWDINKIAPSPSVGAF